MSTNQDLGKSAALIAMLCGAAVCANAAAQPDERMSQQCRIVRASEGWRSTGITVRPNEYVCLAAQGLWSHGVQGIQMITPFYGPEGFAKDDPVDVPEVVSRVGALIARIGQYPPFVVERGLCFIPSAQGELMLSMNDTPGAFGNNAGFMRVGIATSPASLPPDRVRMPSAAACREH
jgi:hypothetical protein